MQSSGSLYEQTEQELTTDRGSDITEGEQQGERGVKMLAPDPEGGKGAMNKERGGLWRPERAADGLPPAASRGSTVLPVHFRL